MPMLRLSSHALCLRIITIASSIVSTTVLAQTSLDSCMKGSGEDAIAACGEEIKKGGYNTYLRLLDRGILYLKDVDYDRAIEDFDRSLKQHKYSVTYAYRGQAWLDGKKNLKRAIDDFTSSIKYYRREGNEHLSGPVVLNRARAYEADGNIRAALDDYKKVLKIDANDEEAKNGVMRLTTSEPSGKSSEMEQREILGRAIQPQPVGQPNTEAASSTGPNKGESPISKSDFGSFGVDNYLFKTAFFCLLAGMAAMLLAFFRKAKPLLPVAKQSHDREKTISETVPNPQLITPIGHASVREKSQQEELSHAIERLEALRAKGILTEDEFKREMEAVLGS